MRILLLNANPVVSRLVELAAANVGAQIEEVRHLSQISHLSYDVVLIDDASYNDENEALLTALQRERTVFFSGRENGEEIGGTFDTVLKKPFLPSQVETLLVAEETTESATETTEREDAPSEDAMPPEEEDDAFYFFLDDEAQSEEREPVLDDAEVARIKALLEESERDVPDTLDTQDEAAYEARKVRAITENLKKEGLEIVEESEIVEHLTEANEEKRREAVRMDGATFLETVRTLKPKKLRKLLKGATVTLTIEFKE